MCIIKCCRYIGVGILVLGIGSLLFASPHYLAGPYRGDQQTENVCQSVTNTSSHSVSDYHKLLYTSRIQIVYSHIKFNFHSMISFTQSRRD